MSTLCGVSARTFLVFMGVLALVGLLGFGLISKGEDRWRSATPCRPPSSPRSTTRGTGSVADHGGKWVLVNVWASWCGPCRDEAPALQSFYERQAGGDFEIVGIDTQETAEAGRGFVEEFGLTYPQLHDGAGEYADELKTKGVPENFLIDPEGDVALVQGDL